MRASAPSGQVQKEGERRRRAPCTGRNGRPQTVVHCPTALAVASLLCTANAPDKLPSPLAASLPSPPSSTSTLTPSCSPSSPSCSCCPVEMAGTSPKNRRCCLCCLCCSLSSSVARSPRSQSPLLATTSYSQCSCSQSTTYRDGRLVVCTGMKVVGEQERVSCALCTVYVCVCSAHCLLPLLGRTHIELGDTGGIWNGVFTARTGSHDTRPVLYG